MNIQQPGDGVDEQSNIINNKTRTGSLVAHMLHVQAKPKKPQMFIVSGDPTLNTIHVP